MGERGRDSGTDGGTDGKGEWEAEIESGQRGRKYISKFSVWISIVWTELEEINLSQNESEV